MKKGQNGKAGVDIDLTSMLDVIFIILLVVMCQQMFTVKEEVKKTEEIQAEYNELYKQYEDVSGNYTLLYDERKNKTEVEKKVAFITIYADYDKEYPQNRHIKTLRDDEMEIGNPYDIQKENEAEVFEKIKGDIIAYLSVNKEIPVLITIDDTQILYRDFVSLKNVFESIRDEGYTNLFCQYQETI